MKMTEIRKETIGMVAQINDSISGLAESAKSVLGYDVLAKLTDKVAQEDLTPTQLALQELGIEVLNRRDVFVYQRERVIERTMVGVAKQMQELSQELVKAWMQGQASANELDRINRFSGPAWTFQKISEYRQPIPEFVLAKAVQIKQRVPECEIYVCGLEDDPDPFLCVGDKKKYSWAEPENIHYVEVWAEPKFEGKMREIDIPF